MKNPPSKTRSPKAPHFKGESSEKLVRKIAEIASSKKAEDILLLDIRKQTGIADFFLICSGTSEVQVKAITDEILDKLSPKVKPWNVEGIKNLHWVLLDFVDVVVHVFHQEARNYYQLERLWSDAKIITYSE